MSAVTTRGIRVAIAAVVAAATLLSGCTSAPPEEDPGPVELLEGQRLATLGTVFQYGAFTVTVGYAVYDAVAQTLFVGTRWHNLSDDYAIASPEFGMLGLRTSPGAAPELAQLPSWESATVPPGGSTEVTYLVPNLEEDPLDAGELIVGVREERLTTISLVDGGGESQLLPREIPIDDWANLGAHTIHVRSALLTAGRLSDNTQLDPDHRVLRVEYDVWTSTPRATGWLAADYLYLRRPDGSVVQSRYVEGVRELTWSAIDNQWAEFTVDDGGSGDYELLLMRRNPGLLGGTVEGNTAVAIPLTIDEVAFAPVSDADRSELLDLPVPVVAARQDPTTPAPTPPPDEEIALELPVLNVPGFLLQFQTASFAPSKGQFSLHGVATSLHPAPAAGIFTSIPNLDLPTALESDGRVRNARLFASGSEAVTGVAVTLTYPTPPGFDPATAILHIGRSVSIALSASEAPAVPVWRVADAEVAAAGEFVVEVLAYRTGLITGADLAPGYVEIELDYTVTSSTDETWRTTYFNPMTQALIAREDGYVAIPQQHNYDHVALKVGEPHEVKTAFAVPAEELESGFFYLLVRSRDESAYPYASGWIETTIPIGLTDRHYPSDSKEVGKDRQAG